MPRSAAITYDGLSISSGGAHTFPVRGFTAGFNALQTFATALSLDPQPRDLVVEVVDGEGVTEFSHPLSADFDQRFEKKLSRGIGVYTGHQWIVDPAELTALIEQLETLRPIPLAGYAGYAAVIHATWNLIFFDPMGEPLLYQRIEDYLGFEADFQRYLGQSCVYSRISEKTTANLFLSLPYDEITDDARKLATKIQTYFPARLSSNHWKIWKLTKGGESYVGRKIQGVI
jgi:hypothetical protein